MSRICDKAGTQSCQDPRGCAMAKPHACTHKPGMCIRRDGRSMMVRCVDVPEKPEPRKTPKARKGEA